MKKHHKSERKIKNKTKPSKIPYSSSHHLATIAQNTFAPHAHISYTVPDHGNAPGTHIIHRLKP